MVQNAVFTFYNAFFKAGLHYDDYRSKLVPFEAQKKFSTFEKALA
jgi:hypothetical protein